MISTFLHITFVWLVIWLVLYLPLCCCLASCITCPNGIPKVIYLSITGTDNIGGIPLTFGTVNFAGGWYGTFVSSCGTTICVYFQCSGGCPGSTGCSDGTLHDGFSIAFTCCNVDDSRAFLLTCTCTCSPLNVTWTTAYGMDANKCTVPVGCQTASWNPTVTL